MSKFLLLFSMTCVLLVWQRWGMKEWIKKHKRALNERYFLSQNGWKLHNNETKAKNKNYEHEERVYKALTVWSRNVELFNLLSVLRGP